MTFTYDLGVLQEPNNTDYDVVRARLALGDTVEKYVHLEDEEIRYFLGRNSGNFAGGVADCAEAVGMRYAHEASHSTGDLRLDLDVRAQRWLDMAITLRAQSGGSGGKPEPLEGATNWYFYPNMNTPYGTEWEDMTNARIR